MVIDDLVQAARETLTSAEAHTAPSVILNLPNRVLAYISGNKNILSVWLSSLLLGALICLPSYILATILRESKQINDIGWTVFNSLQLSYLSVIVTYIDINLNIFRHLKQRIIPVMTGENDLLDLRKYIQLASIPLCIPSITVLGIIIGLVALIGGTLIYSHDPGFGLPLSAIFFGIFGGVSVYYLGWVLKLTHQLGNYRFLMNDFTPASSKIIHDISSMLNIHTYIVALFLAAVTAIDSFDKLTAWFVWVDILFGWIPIIAQFILTQNAIRKIILNAKWNTIEHIQIEIRTINHLGHLKDKDTTDSINRLMDLQDRIEKTRDNTIDFKSTRIFINQLLLPVISWIMVNFEKLLLTFRNLFNT
jgi:hypothetical protein